MKIKEVLQGCSSRAKSRSKSPFGLNAGTKYSDEIKEIETNSDDEMWNVPSDSESRGGLAKAEIRGNDSNSNIKTSKEAYDMRSHTPLASKQVTWKDRETETIPEKEPIDELYDVNKLLEKENSLLRKDVHRVEERVRQLERFLEECKKAKAHTSVDSSPTKDVSGDYWRIKNENLSMSETMKVLAKLVQRQEQSLQRHRYQAIAHQNELRERRNFIQELERELNEKQKNLREIRRKDLEYQMRVKSVERQVRGLGDEASIEHSEHDLGVRKILLGIHPKCYDELPPIQRIHESSSSSDSSSEQQKIDENSKQYSMNHLNQTLESVKQLKSKLEAEQLYLLNQRELIKRGESNISSTDDFTESSENLVTFESRSTCSASDVTFDG